MKGFYCLITLVIVGCLGLAISAPIILDAAEQSVIQANLERLAGLEKQAFDMDQKEHQDEPESIEAPGVIDVIPNPFTKTEKESEEERMEVANPGNNFVVSVVK